MLRYLIVAVLLFGAVFTGLMVFSNDIFNNYGVTTGGIMQNLTDAIDSSIQQSYDVQGNVSDKMETPQGITSDSPTSVNVGVSVFSAISLVYGTMKFLPTLITNLFLMFDLGGYGMFFAVLFTTILAVMITFWIASAVRGKDL